MPSICPVSPSVPTPCQGSTPCLRFPPVHLPAPHHPWLASAPTPHMHPPPGVARRQPVSPGPRPPAHGPPSTAVTPPAPFPAASQQTGPNMPAPRQAGPAPAPPGSSRPQGPGRLPRHRSPRPRPGWAGLRPTAAQARARAEQRQQGSARLCWGWWELDPEVRGVGPLLPRPGWGCGREGASLRPWKELTGGGGA